VVRRAELRRPARVSLIGLAIGPALWIVAFQFDSFAQSLQQRISLVAAISASYALLAARELWYARDRDLISRWPTLVLVIGHAGFLLARIPYAQDLAASVSSGHAHGAVATVMAFEALFVAFCLPFLRVAMSKERAELKQRLAAETDPLTGVPNRRAFFDRGNPLLDHFIAERQPAALLLFDLDRFKDINDTAGHQAGDRVLRAFCDLVGTSVRPVDLFGRLGGEEFAYLMANVSVTQALQTGGAAAAPIRCAAICRPCNHADGQCRRRHGERSGPQLVGAAGACRPGALSRQGRWPQSRRAGAVHSARGQRRRSRSPPD
jgi:diguanylate cyclase (GGDEF)-like protein